MSPLSHPVLLDPMLLIRGWKAWIPKQGDKGQVRSEVYGLQHRMEG